VDTMKLTRDDVFIGGRFVPAHGTERQPIVNPATEQAIGHAAVADADDVGAAVAAARSALPGWRELSFAERGAYLRAIADGFTARGEEMATLVTTESGAVITRSRAANAAGPAGTYRYHAKLGEDYAEETVYESGGRRTVLRREPIGVVGAITPWNTPEGVLAIQIAPALLAGCTVVIKPSPETSLDALVFGEITAEAGLPPGVVNVVTGGAQTGSALVGHRGTDKITFTGSSATGRRIAALCGEQLKPVTLELGGKSAAIVLDDADIGTFASQVISTCIPNTGQNCTAATRILAPRHRFDDIVSVVLEQVAKAPLGEPMDPASEFGPLVSARQRDRVEEYIRSGRDEGARLILGGGRPAEFPAGYYVEPAVFVDVTRSMRIFREEIFGPVLSVVPYADEDEAVQIANDSEYGLSGSVFSADREHAVAVARRLETGGVRINGQKGVEGVSGYTYKDSGAGGGRELPAYLNLKAISAKL
jgi:aldehyde dehydrogenase (NAD+)